MKILSRLFFGVKVGIDTGIRIVYNIVMLKSYEEVQKQAKELERIARRMKREEMQVLRDKGWSLEKIGKEYGGISRERVRQILEEREEGEEE